jgi:hypothetical protein
MDAVVGKGLGHLDLAGRGREWSGRIDHDVVDAFARFGTRWHGRWLARKRGSRRRRRGRFRRHCRRLGLRRALRDAFRNARWFLRRRSGRCRGLGRRCCRGRRRRAGRGGSRGFAAAGTQRECQHESDRGQVGARNHHGATPVPRARCALRGFGKAMPRTGIESGATTTTGGPGSCVPRGLRACWPPLQPAPRNAGPGHRSPAPGFPRRSGPWPRLP